MRIVSGSLLIWRHTLKSEYSFNISLCGQKSFDDHLAGRCSRSREQRYKKELMQEKYGKVMLLWHLCENWVQKHKKRFWLNLKDIHMKFKKSQLIEVLKFCSRVLNSIQPCLIYAASVSGIFLWLPIWLKSYLQGFHSILFNFIKKSYTTF